MGSEQRKIKINVNRLKALKKQNRETIADLAESLNFSESTIAHLFSEGMTTDYKINALAKHYKVSPYYLTGQNAFLPLEVQNEDPALFYSKSDDLNLSDENTLLITAYEEARNAVGKDNEISAFFSQWLMC